MDVFTLTYQVNKKESHHVRNRIAGQNTSSYRLFHFLYYVIKALLLCLFSQYNLPYFALIQFFMVTIAQESLMVTIAQESLMVTIAQESLMVTFIVMTGNNFSQF